MIVTKDLKTLKLYLPLLAEKRSENYNDWNIIGYIIYKYTNGSAEGFKLFDEFSSRCTSKYDQNNCSSKWDDYEGYNYNYSIRTVVYFAGIDSPQQYKQIIETKMKLDRIGSNGSHGGIAKILYDMFKNEFICSNLSHKLWFHYIDHRWKRMDQAVHVRLKIWNDIRKLFQSIYDQHKRKKKQLQAAQNDSDNDSDTDQESSNNKIEIKILEDKLKKLKKIRANLENWPFLKNVINMAQDLFYEKNETFFEQLDQNPKL